MKKNILKIFFVLIVLFSANNCFAKLANPEDLNVTNVQQINGTFEWTQPEEGGGTLERFKLFYKEATSTVSEWSVKYPTILNEDEAESTATYTAYKFSLKGLNPGTEYEWGLIAEAEDSSNNSDFVEGNNFATEESAWIEESPEEGEEGAGSEPINLQNPFGDTANLGELADQLMTFLATTAFAVAPILIIYAGFLLLTKQDSPDSLKRAKGIILWTVVALAIILFAKGVPSVIADLFS